MFEKETIKAFEEKFKEKLENCKRNNSDPLEIFSLFKDFQEDLVQKSTTSESQCGDTSGGKCGPSSSEKLGALIFGYIDDDYLEDFNFKIKDCYVNEEKRTVVIKWADNSTTKSTCHKADTFDPVAGFAIAFAKHYYGSSKKFHEFALKNINKNSEKKYTLGEN